MATRPYYLIERSPKARLWRVMHFKRSTDTIGTVLGHWPTRKQAVTTTRLLAGRDADVIISHHKES